MPASFVEGDPAVVRGPQRVVGGEPGRSDHSRHSRVDIGDHDPSKSVEDHLGRQESRVGRPDVDGIGPAKGQVGSELSSMLTVDADHVQVRTTAADRPERDEPAVRRTAHPLRVVAGRKDRPDRSISDIDRLELAMDGDDERPVLDRSVHRPRDRERHEGRQDEQDDETQPCPRVESSMAIARPPPAGGSRARGDRSGAYR